MRGFVLLTVALGGCDYVLGLEPRAGDAGSALVCSHETFDSDVLPAWTKIIDQGVRLVVAADLTITPSSMMDGYGILQSMDTHDLTRGHVQVQTTGVLNPAAGLETFFELARDSAQTTETYSIVIEPGSGSSNQLHFMTTSDQGDPQDVLSVGYDPVMHRGLRIAHRVQELDIGFYSSSNGIDWKLEHHVPARFGLVGLTIVIGAGRSIGGVVDPGVARFDDFELCRAM